MHAGSACLLAFALLLLPSALLAAAAAALLLLNFTLASLLVQHGLQPHTQPRGGAQPGAFASLCRQIVSHPFCGACPHAEPPLESFPGCLKGTARLQPSVGLGGQTVKAARHLHEAPFVLRR